MQLSKIITSTSYIVYNKNIADKIGKNGALLLSHFVNVFEYAKKTNTLHLAEWFFCKIEDTTARVSLSRFEQENEINTLVSKGILEKKVMGVPAKRYFRFAQDAENCIIKLANKVQFVSELQTEKMTKNKSSLKEICSQVCKSVTNQFVSSSQTINSYSNNLRNNYSNNINICENSFFSLNLNDEKISKIRMNLQNKTNMEITKQELNSNSLICENQTNQQQESPRNPIGFKIGNDDSYKARLNNDSKPDFSTQKQELVVLPNKQDKGSKISLKKQKTKTAAIIPSEQIEKTSPKPSLITNSRFADFKIFQEEFIFADKNNTANPHQFEYVDTLKLWEAMITDAEARGSKANKYINFISAARNWAKIAENNKRYESFMKSDDVMYDYTINTFLEKFNKGTHQITSEDKMYAVKLVEKIKRVKTQPDLKAAIDNLLFSTQFGLIGHIQRENNNPTKPKIFSHFVTFKAIFNHFEVIKCELVAVFNEYKAKREKDANVSR